MTIIDLKDVALCAPDFANLALTAKALNLSTTGCDFGDVMLLSDVAVEGSFRHVPIDRIASRDAYQVFVLKTLPFIVKAPFVLLIQWDGYVLDPTCWLSEFRQYDYIGATWPWHKDGLTVGNGGFSLRSKKLLEAVAQPRFEIPTIINEDDYICRVHRPVLENEYGIRFAPEAIANRFAYERRLPDGPTFGFHGLFNMWRHVDDAEMVKIVNEIGGYFIKSREYAEALMLYFELRKFAPLRAFYKRLRADRNLIQVHSHLTEIIRDEKLVTECIRTCENLMSNNVAPAIYSKLEQQAGSTGRNQPCPCGSGKRYKHCHGALSAPTS